MMVLSPRLPLALVILTVASTVPLTASACLKATVLADAQDSGDLERFATLSALDTRCRQGLTLLGEGRYGEALPLLTEADGHRELMTESLALPLAEAMFGAGAPVEATLQRWEALTEPQALVEARRAELVMRLPSGRAEALLGDDANRPAARLLAARVKLDAEAPEEARVPTPIRPERVGVLLPLSGRLAPLGRAILAGIHLGLDEHTTLLVRDSGGGSVAAVRQVRELAAEGVIAIVGPLDRSVGRAAADVAESVGVPLLRLSVEDEKRPTTRWVFRAFFSRRSEYRALVSRARREGVKRFAIAAVETGYGKELARVFREEVAAAGGRVVTEVTYPEATTNFEREAKRLAARRFGALFIADKSSRAASVMRFLAGQDVWTRGKRARVGKRGEVRYIQLFAPSDWLGQPLGADDRRYLDGAILAAEWPGAGDDDVADFVSRATSALGRAPGLFEAVGYDAVRLVRTGRSTERRELVVRLREPTPFDGVLGPVRFDESGEPARTPRLFRATDERYKRLPSDGRPGAGPR